MSLITELKRRNVIRMAGLYLLGAWLIAQVAETILPAFEVPNWVMRAIVIVLALGFVPAVIFAWVFELTPGGIKRDEEVDRDQSIAPQTARRMDRMLLLVAVLALGYFAFDKFVLAPQRDAALVVRTTEKIDAAVDAKRSEVNPNSIAVLPFVNMSGDKANEYFSDGISEEILNVLAQIPKLQVVARTSSFSFKGAGKEVPDIAKELKVRMVLEGSVRKQGERVRITAQLIDAGNGFHVWSQTYDRDLKDIFAIQDEIAKAIADELKVTLRDKAAPGENTAGTSNLKAYDLYLRGINLWQTREDDKLWQAIDLFEQATVADPKFAKGYAGQAMVYSNVASYSKRMPQAETFARARDLAEQALALDPASAEAYAVLGTIAANAEYRRVTATALLTRAIALRPSFATAYQWRGALLTTGGDPAAGLADLERASALDPRDLLVVANQALVLRTLGRDADASAVCQRALERPPAFFACLEISAMAELQLGDLDAARSMLERLAAIINPSASAQGRALADTLAGRGDRQALARFYATLPINSRLDATSGNAFVDGDIPEILILLGEQELALRFIERLAAQADSGADYTVMMPAMDPIRCEPRFVAVVKKLKTHDPRHATVCKGNP